MDPFHLIIVLLKMVLGGGQGELLGRFLPACPGEGSKTQAFSEGCQLLGGPSQLSRPFKQLPGD